MPGETVSGTTPIMCPVCMHEETVRARTHEREPCYDDEALMDWRRAPGGARGQIVTRWDRGSWVCRACGCELTPHDACVLLDAALMHRDPSCDSIVDGIHSDARRAAAGGPA